MLSVSIAGRRKAETTPPVRTGVGVAVAVLAGAPVYAPLAAPSDGVPSDGAHPALSGSPAGVGWPTSSGSPASSDRPASSGWPASPGSPAPFDWPASSGWPAGVGSPASFGWPAGVDAASVGEADTVTPCAPSASVTVVPGGSTVSKELEACSMRQAPETSSAPASSMVMDTAPARPPATCPLARSSESRLSRVDTATGASTGTS